MKILVSATILAASIGLATAATASAPRISGVGNALGIVTSMTDVEEVGYRGGKKGGGGWKHRGHKGGKKGHHGWKPRGHGGHGGAVCKVPMKPIRVPVEKPSNEAGVN